MPTQIGYLAPTRLQALNCELGDITLELCRNCGHVWNSSLDPGKIALGPDYDSSEYYSDTYREYVSSSIDRLESRYKLTGKTALEIGCGKGDYLRMLIAAGFAKGIGFDPTFVETGFSEESRRHITIYRKNFGPEDSALKPDLIACRSVLQYFPKPRDLLRCIRAALEDRLDTVVYFEVPNAAEAFRKKHVWYVMYEAGCFFSPSSLARIFRECGFEVLDILPALGDSQLEIEARPSLSARKHASEDPQLIAEIDQQVAGFAVEYATQVKKWSEQFDRHRKQ
ncbi:MAG: class I SAM-dependent methyltransferase [Candidatus Acidiferrum sp.]